MRLRREGRNGGIGGFSLSVAEGNTQGVGYYGGFKRLKQAADAPPLNTEGAERSGSNHSKSKDYTQKNWLFDKKVLSLCFVKLQITKQYPINHDKQLFM
ncbi:MAG: hypothetical protein IJ502_01880 [Alistipes sp.]|nr:hypothetical protein [Alistipes sp.]